VFKHNSITQKNWLSFYITLYMPKLTIILVILFFASTDIQAQVKADTLVKKLDSLSHKNDSTGGQKNNIQPAAYNEQTKITGQTYFILLWSSVKQEFTKPFHTTKKEWLRFGMFAGGVAILTTVDEPVQKWALRLRNNNQVVASTGRYITNAGGTNELITLSGIGLYGFLTKNTKMKTTTLLASQAYITSALVESTLKLVFGRTRPSFYDPTEEAEPKFLGPFGKTSRDFSGARSNSSFPSGHATAAFAAATVYAMEYKNSKWVPILSYSAASLIALSRITENKHWTTDILVGSVLGYFSGRHIVNNYHRYAKLKASQQPKNSISFAAHYNVDHVEPGITWKF
jgi:membrane-associated phospholipid phosphatase